MNQRTALIVGATGLVGRQCLDILLEDELYSSVVALVRRPLPKTHPKLTAHVIDFDRLEDSRALMRADDVFSCLGTTIKVAGSQEAFRKVDFSYPLTVATIAAEEGGKEFMIVSSLGASATSSVFYTRVKGELEEAVQKLPYRSIGIFRPSILAGDRAEARPGERIGLAISSVIAPLLVGPLRKYRPIQARDVARCMVTIARRSIPGVNIYQSDRIAAIAAGKES